MTIRKRTGRFVETVAGRENLRRLRRTEARIRGNLAAWIAMPPATSFSRAVPPTKPDTVDEPDRQDRAAIILGPKDSRPRFGPPDPFVSHPKPSMTRHQFLVGLHERLRPRTYVEIGIREGRSLALARCKAIGVDPAYRIETELQADLRLFRLTSDEFFARPDALDHFGGVPIDLAFIDGMHLSEFAYRDFANVEPVMAPGGVVIFDDILPRNPLEAARDRKTGPWAGDVYKAVEVLRRRRTDLLVLLVNTAPTGTAIVLRVDPQSTSNAEIYDSELSGFLASDPQAPPPDFMDRSAAVDPCTILELEVWDRLVAERDSPNGLIPVWDAIASLPVANPRSDSHADFP